MVAHATDHDGMDLVVPRDAAHVAPEPFAEIFVNCVAAVLGGENNMNENAD